MNPEAGYPGRTRRKRPGWRRWRLVFLVVGSISWLCACSTLPSGEPTAGQETVYRSKDFIVYTSTNQRSPEELASEFLGDPGKSWMITEANESEALASGAAIVIPLVMRNKGGVRRKGFQTIPVLTYHRFGDNCDSPLCMPARVFDQQMRYLKDNGYRTVTPEEMLDFLLYRNPLPQKSVCSRLHGPD